MRIYGLSALALAGAFALAGCGSGGSSSHAATPVGAAAVGAPQTTAAIVKTGDTSLGKVLTNSDGRTLYGLTKDADGSFQCVTDCAVAWPPLLVPGTSLPAGLDAKLFSVVTRPDGTHQLRAGKWPLYRFSGDAHAGDVNGQGTGAAFFAVSPDGKLRK